jgi:hypothetical protein
LCGRVWRARVLQLQPAPAGSRQVFTRRLAIHQGRARAVDTDILPYTVDCRSLSLALQIRGAHSPEKICPAGTTGLQHAHPSNTHALTYTHTHTHTHALTYTHTHTHTHTHICTLWTFRVRC